MGMYGKRPVRKMPMETQHILIQPTMGTVKTATIKENTSYYEVTAESRGTGYYKYTDGNGATYTQNDNSTLAGSDGNTYKIKRWQSGADRQ